MKKIIFLFFATIFSVACSPEKHVDEDYVGISYYTWVNVSDHTITLTGTHSREKNNILNATLSSGERVEWEEFSGIIAYCLPPSGMRFKNLIVSFDGDVEVPYELPREYADYLVAPEGFDGRFSILTNENYLMEYAKSKECPKCAARRWTYTFTNADYEAAKRLASRE